MQLLDAHCHVQDKQFETDRDSVLARMAEAGVGAIVVGTDTQMSEKAIAVADSRDNIWATVGIHPTDNHAEIFNEAKYIALAMHPKVVAIGECGLDYYWPEHDKWPHGEAAEKERQKNLFEAQIKLAQNVGLPLMIHGRPSKGSMDAYEDILVLLEKYPKVGGNVHFFVGTPEIAQRFLDRGFMLSFTGVLTFTSDYEEVVKMVPLDHLLTETDAPYVAPVPYRGKRNEPQFVSEVVKKVAQIKGISEDAVARAVIENARKLFKLA